VLRSRPEVRLSVLTDPARVGGLVELALDIVCADETRLDSIGVRFAGMERVEIDDQRGELRTPFELARRLAEHVVLTPGTHRYHAAFFVPRDAPPTYDGARVHVAYSVEVVLVRPWARDVEGSFPVVLHPRAGPRLPSAPIGERAGDGGPASIEVALDDRVYAPGDLVEGAFALRRLRPSDRLARTQVTASLVALERSGPGFARVTERLRIVSRHDVHAAQEGRAVRLAARIPECAPASHATASWGLSWHVECRISAGPGTGTKARVPILVVSLEGAPRAGEARPPVGDERARTGLAAAGAPYGLGLDASGGARLVGRVGGCRVAVEPAAEGELSGELVYPDLGLGLALIVRKGSGDVAEATSAIRVRDLEQLRAAGGSSLARALGAFGSVEMSDVRAVARGAAPVRESTWDARALLAALVDLAAHIGVIAARVPPPRGTEPLVPAWRAFAESLGAQLVVGSLGIRGGLWRGARVDIWTRFGEDGAPARTEVVMELGAPLGEALDAAALDRLPLDVRDLVDGIAAQAQSLRIGPEKARIVLPAPLEDPAKIGLLLDDVAAVVAKIGRERRSGPYR
jgi:hypothetical protein